MCYKIHNINNFPSELHRLHKKGVIMYTLVGLASLLTTRDEQTLIYLRHAPLGVRIRVDDSEPQAGKLDGSRFSDACRVDPGAGIRHLSDLFIALTFSPALCTVHRPGWHPPPPITAKLTTTDLPLLSALVKPSSAVIDLGVNIDGQLTMADHVIWETALQVKRPNQQYQNTEGTHRIHK